MTTLPIPLPPCASLQGERNSLFSLSVLSQFLWGVVICSDPTCGSGRTLLSWHVRHLGSYLCAEDIDRTCCMMTVCNLLIHAGVGEVVWHDSLDPETFFDGWKVNESLNTTGLPTVRRISKEESIVWRNWQSQKNGVEEPTQSPIKIVSMKEKREDAQKLQLSLFG